MTDIEKAEEYANKILSDSKYSFIFSKEKVKKYIIKVYLDFLKCCERAYNVGLAEGRKESKTEIEKLKEILSFEEYREQFQKGERTLLGKTISEWLIYQNENAVLREEYRQTEKDYAELKVIAANRKAFIDWCAEHHEKVLKEYTGFIK